MMARKLAGMFAMMAVAAYLAAWIYVRNIAAGEPSMEPDEALAWAVCVAVIFFLVGLFLATLGIGLLQEVLAERRSRELERLFRAKIEYDRVVLGDGGAPPGSAAPADANAAGAAR